MLLAGLASKKSSRDDSSNMAVAHRSHHAARPYRPTTLHPASLGGFALVCLGLVAAIECLVRSGALASPSAINAAAGGSDGLEKRMIDSRPVFRPFPGNESEQQQRHPGPATTYNSTSTLYQNGTTPNPLAIHGIDFLRGGLPGYKGPEEVSHYRPPKYYPTKIRYGRGVMTIRRGVARGPLWQRDTSTQATNGGLKLPGPQTVATVPTEPQGVPVDKPTWLQDKSPHHYEYKYALRGDYPTKIRHWHGPMIRRGDARGPLWQRDTSTQTTDGGPTRPDPPTVATIPTGPQGVPVDRFALLHKETTSVNNYRGQQYRPKKVLFVRGARTTQRGDARRLLRRQDTATARPSVQTGAIDRKEKDGPKPSSVSRATSTVMVRVTETVRVSSVIAISPQSVASTPEPSQPPPPPSPSPSASAVPGGVGSKLGADENPSAALQASLYFSDHYLPTLVAVLLAVYWRAVDSDLKRMQPFYELSEPASGSKLNENLLLTNALLVPFRAAARGNWAIVISALVYGPLLTAVQLLAASAIFLTPGQSCSALDDPESFRCGTIWLAGRLSTARMLEAALAAVAAAALLLACLQARRACLLRAEPFSIAGLASLLADGPTPSLAPGQRYVLAEWTLAGVPHLAIDSLSPPGPNPGEPAASLEGEGGEGEEEEDEDPWRVRPAMLVVFVAFMLGIVVLILIYRFTADSAMEPFLSGQTVGVKLFFTALALLIRWGWMPIEYEARHTEVFRQLARGHQPLSTLLLSSSGSSHTRTYIPIVSDVCALARGQLYVAAVGFVGVAIEVLVVILAGVPYSDTQTWVDANVSLFMSAAILLITCAMVVAFAVVRRRHSRETGSASLSRVPSTVKGVMRLLYRARMLDAFGGGLAALDTAARDRRLVHTCRGMTFAFGWNVGGAKCLGIDCEEQLGEFGEKGC